MFREPEGSVFSRDKEIGSPVRCSGIGKQSGG